MKAVVQCTYGPPEEVLTYQDLARPPVKDGEVLVRVHAASVHVGDVIRARGLPYVLRLATGLRNSGRCGQGTRAAPSSSPSTRRRPEAGDRCDAVEVWWRPSPAAARSRHSRLRSARS